MVTASLRARTRRTFVFLAMLGLAATLLTSCSQSVSTSNVIQAVGAENQYANVIDQIGGKYVHVSAVMSNPNTDPHTFEVSASVAQSIASAQLIVQNGLGYDSFMNQLESASPSRTRRVLSVQSLLGLPSTTKNPHFWYAPTTMPVVARAIESALVKLSPRHATYFEQRLVAFMTSLQTLNDAVATFRSKFAGVKVATTEPVADYLLQALGVNNVTPFRFQADIMNGVDPSPQDISFENALLTKGTVVALCYNAQVSNTVTITVRSLATRSRVPVVAVYETMPTPGFTYQTWMLAEIKALTKAITTKASTLALGRE